VRAAIFFFPFGFHPVLDGGEGDEDPVVPPEVPGCRPVGKTVLDDQPDGERADAMSVRAFDGSQVGQVHAEIELAAGAFVDGVSDFQDLGAAGDQVANVVELSMGLCVAAALVTALGAGTAAAGSGNGLTDGFGDIGGSGKTVVGHGPSLLGSASHEQNRK
jgi:hypothetical protein